MTIKNSLRPWLALAYVLVIPLVVTIQNISLGPNDFWDSVHIYTHFNNFIIFKNSFNHLVTNQNLYTIYLEEYADIFKYSPTFALFMAPFSVLHPWIGLFLWNLLGVFVLFVALNKVIEDKSKLTIILLVIIPELYLSTLNSQSNALITGLIVLAFYFLEHRKNGLAALMIVCTVFIKLFTLVAFIMFLFYPDRIKSFLWTLMWMVLFILLPLIVISPDSLFQQYAYWLKMLKLDHSESYGLGLLGLLNSFSPWVVYKLVVFIFGLVILILPLVRFQKWNLSIYRRYYLCLILIWMVLLNHKAESPTYILVITGAALWAYFDGFSRTATIILTACFIFTSLICTDLCPKSIRVGIMEPYCIKAIVPVVIMLLLSWRLLFAKKEEMASGTS